MFNLVFVETYLHVTLVVVTIVSTFQEDVVVSTSTSSILHNFHKSHQAHSTQSFA